MWAPIIQKWISTEKEKLSDLLAKPNSAEQLQRLLQIKRLAFVEIALPMDSVSDKLDTFVSRMQDAVDSSGISHAMGLMLMQSIILRTSQVHIRDHIMNFIHLLQRSFLLLIESSTNPQPDTVLLCTTLRTLDVMLYLGNEDFQL
ncbi:protein of unknown function [Taphrina deformans PYCC 5710]|uniref:DOP1-like C-terminal domain-containing protein n=1 Tax=Taphrina deformans (strain PYCC 5710 / ATCC 11124 / CBS 356.35 / IMI 108563 / JCM 9778 / NBRC 8474) TaxID=1097556 RepID=R4XDY3_TAPDE|nr:protein of unknown function [Taphrina deformans PYCC 5710]|eukprot:CCG84035.1 protein of unknown function [Taphrina deformans PYCC 5710]